MSDPIHPLRLLLVEDDPISQSFIAEALSGMPAIVDTAADIAQAVQAVRTHRHDLWLIDAHLPDGDGSQCLAVLRRLHDTPALAITAGASRCELDLLCATGFLEVLLKPASIAQLQGTVRRLLGESVERPPEPTGAKLPVWDEDRALAAMGGNRKSLQSLRGMFLEELPGLRQQMLAAQRLGDADSMQSVLHKLKAGCGFVGAARLARAVEVLSASPLDSDALRRFDFAATDALEWQDAQP